MLSQNSYTETHPILNDLAAAQNKRIHFDRKRDKHKYVTTESVHTFNCYCFIDFVD